MNTNNKKSALTLGALIESGCRACGKRRASAIIRLAAEARLIVFQEDDPLAVQQALAPRLVVDQSSHQTVTGQWLPSGIPEGLPGPVFSAGAERQSA